MPAWASVASQAMTITGFVAVMMLMIEYANSLTRGAWQTHLAKHPFGQYVLGALLGATPGCLGAFAVVGMYTHGLVTHGAVIATMVATMGDESFVMFALMPKQALVLHGLLLVLGVLAGALSDVIARPWIPLKPATCGALILHPEQTCGSVLQGKILHQWKNCSATRGALTASLLLLVIGVITGRIGPPIWDWIRVTLLLTFSAALAIAATVPEHFLEEHLWNHVVRRHVPKIFLWTFGALLASDIIGDQLHLDGELKEGRWLLLTAACLIGLIPESGPHLIFLTLYARGSIPFSILLASSIVQDGHGMLPLLAHSRRAFAGIKIVNFAIGMLVGATAMLVGW